MSDSEVFKDYADSLGDPKIITAVGDDVVDRGLTDVIFTHSLYLGNELILFKSAFDANDVDTQLAIIKNSVLTLAILSNEVFYADDLDPFDWGDTHVDYETPNPYADPVVIFNYNMNIIDNSDIDLDKDIIRTFTIYNIIYLINVLASIDMTLDDLINGDDE